MLVLSRQRDETIMIGDDVEITIVDIRGDKVRLGITAPSRVAVHRKEVYESITRENRQAAGIAHHEIERLGPAVQPTASPGSARPGKLARLASPTPLPAGSSPPSPSGE